MDGKATFALLSLSSILIWPIALTIMFMLRRRFHPSNKKYAAFRALAYVLIFWTGRVLGTLSGHAAGFPAGMGMGASPQNFFMVLFGLPIAFVWIIIAYRTIERASWKELGWNFSSLKREIVFGALMGGAIFLLRRYQEIFAQNPSIHINPRDAIFLFLASFGVASWQEENIYRGYLQPKLEAVASKWKAILGQAALFSIAHIGFYPFEVSLQFLLGLLELALVGIILGYYRRRFNSLVAPFIAHGLLDFLPIFWRS